MDSSDGSVPASLANSTQPTINDEKSDPNQGIQVLLLAPPLPSSSIIADNIASNSQIRPSLADFFSIYLTNDVAKSILGKGLSNEVTGADTFHYFPSFPTEIRRMIWKAALPEARIIEIEWDIGAREFCAPIESRGEVCSLPSVNMEARECFLKEYIPRK